MNKRNTPDYGNLDQPQDDKSTINKDHSSASSSEQKDETLPLLTSNAKKPISYDGNNAPPALTIRALNSPADVLHQFRRVFLSEPWTLKLLASPHIEVERQGKNKQVKKFQAFLMGGAIPQKDPIVRRRLWNVWHFLNGFSRVTYGLVLPGFSALLLHDVLAYAFAPDDRYGNTVLDIFLGTSPNLRGLSTHLGSYLPQEPTYWIGPALLTAFYATVPLIHLVFALVQQRYPELQVSSVGNIQSIENNSVSIFPELTRRLQNCSWFNLASSSAAFALLWDRQLTANERTQLTENIMNIAAEPSLRSLAAISTLGNMLAQMPLRTSADEIFYAEIHSKLAKPARWYHWLPSQYARYRAGASYFAPLSVLFGLGLAYQSYVFGRLGVLLASKIQAAASYFNAAHACEATGNIWQYLPAWGDSYCVRCDWPEVYYPNRFNGQSCVNDLLQLPRDSSTIVNRLSSLSNESRAEIHTLDLSRQSWPLWPLSDWQQFWTNWSTPYQVKFHSLTSVNISQPLPSNAPLPTDWTIPLTSVLAQQPVTTFSANNVPFTGTQMASLVHASQATNIELDGINQTVEDTTSLVQSPHFSSIQRLSVNRANLTDTQFDTLVTTPGHLTSLSAENNQFTEALFPVLSIRLPEQPRLSQLDIGGHDFSLGNFTQLGNTISQSNITELEMSNIQFQDDTFCDFATAMAQHPNATLRVWDISGNALTNFAFQCPSFSSLPVTDWTISGNSFDLSGFASFWNATWSRMTRLVWQNDGMGNGLVSTMVSPASSTLITVDLSGQQIDNEVQSNLATLFKESPVKTASFNNNRLIHFPVVAHSQVSSLSLAENPLAITATDVIHLAQSTPLEHLNIENTPPFSASDVASVYESLITPTPHLKEDGDPTITSDEGHALSKAQPTTLLSSIKGLAPNTPENARLRCRLSSVGDTSEDFLMALDEQGINLETCESLMNQKNSEARHQVSRYPVYGTFFSSSVEPRIPIQPLPSSSVSETSSFIIGLSCITGVGLALLALYLLYRAIKPLFETKKSQPSTLQILSPS